MNFISVVYINNPAALLTVTPVACDVIYRWLHNAKTANTTSQNLIGLQMSNAYFDCVLSIHWMSTLFQYCHPITSPDVVMHIIIVKHNLENETFRAWSFHLFGLHKKIWYMVGF